MLSGQGRRHARRLLELRGDPAAPGAQAPRRDPRRPGGRAHLRRAGAGRARSEARTPRRRTCGRSCRRSPAASARCAPTRRPPPSLVVKANPSLEPQAAAGIDPADAARRPAPRSEQALRLAGARRRGRPSAAGCSPTSCSSTTPTSACRRSPTSSCRGRGSRGRAELLDDRERQRVRSRRLAFGVHRDDSERVGAEG